MLEKLKLVQRFQTLGTIFITFYLNTKYLFLASINLHIRNRVLSTWVC